MPDSPVYLHIDMDSFFASIEAHHHPQLQGLPIVVGADPLGGKGRGVVSTCSYEARRFGIHSGMPISRAYYCCPSAIFLPVNFPLYCRTSERIMAIIKEMGDFFEQVSIDEAYLQLDGSHEKGVIKEIAENIQQEIWEKEYLTCSIGGGLSRVVAKIASDYQKPRGITIVSLNDTERFLFPLSVRKLPGIGTKTAEALSTMGISTIGQLASCDIQEMVGIFGKLGRSLFSLANGRDIILPRSPSHPRSIGRETTFMVDTTDQGMVDATVDMLISEVHRALISSGLFFRTISVKVRYSGFTTRCKSHTVSHSSNDIGLMRKITRSLLYQCLDERKIRLVGVRLSFLSGNTPNQCTLLDFSA